jgi:WD40 repeat protein
MAWDAQGNRLATACFDGIRLWDAATGERLQFHETGVPILAMEWCPRREIIVGGTQESTMLIWNIGREDAFQAGPFEVKMRELSFHYSGDYLVTGGGSDVTLWNFSNPDMQGERPVFLEAHQQLISVLSWQTAGPLFASGGRDGAVYIWKPLQVKQPLVYTHLETPVTALAWQARDSGVIAATEGGLLVSIPAPGRG